MNIIFFGSPSYSSNVLSYIFNSKHKIKAVVTQDIKNKRNKKEPRTPVGVFSELNNIQTYYPSNLSDEEFINNISNQGADIFLIYAYGKILPKELISIPKYGVINIHCSLLPRWRGAAPIQRALLNNDKLTGVTFFKIDEHLDTGKIISSYEYPINESHDTLSLQDDLTSLAIKNIEDIFHKAINHNDFNPQDNNKATYARKLTKEESVISWEEDAISIISKIKAFAGWPGVQAELFKVKFKIIKAHLSAKTSSLDYGSIVTFNHDKFEIQVKNGIIEIDKLQLLGKNIITCRDLYNSNSEFSAKIKNYSVK